MTALRRPSGTSRYLALVFPWLPSERLRADRPHVFVGRDDAPIAFTETVRGIARLAAVDPAAARHGLRPGLSLAEAKAQVPELTVFPHDAHADLDWLERLADGCERYTDAVTLDPPDALTLDVTQCLYASDSERRLATDVEERLARRGITLRHAFGDTPHAARALARFSGAPAPDEARALRRLPVAALELDAEDEAALTQAGLKTIGDVMAQPASGVAARFGKEAATALRQLTQEGKAPAAPRARVEPIRAERRLAVPVKQADGLLILGELAGEAIEALEGRRSGGRLWKADLFRSDGQVQRLRVGAEHQIRDSAMLVRLLRERMDGLSDPIGSGVGYDLIRLDVVLAEPLDASQLRLEGGGDQRMPVEPLPGQPLAGDNNVRTRRRRQRSPEQVELSLPVAGDTQAPANWTESQVGEAPLRPIHLFDPPQPIESLATGSADGPPARFRWQRKLHDVARVEGPERIVGTARHRQPAVATREYFRLEDRRGRRFWIFRQGGQGDEVPPRWYVHGLFA
ncbi:Y-family DNA polymerase [Sphingomonas gellani]|uniref:Y-family DNA polymerase n=1 Tax=Sphingomonas gellani TaxID=1166340 RepID=UPI001FCCFDEB|nr:DNA polymerase Y family protein [Sphingomonas gellani]